MRNEAADLCKTCGAYWACECRQAAFMCSPRADVATDSTMLAPGAQRCTSWTLSQFIPEELLSRASPTDIVARYLDGTMPPSLGPDDPEDAEPLDEELS